MGRASMINGFVASAMGVVANELVESTSTFTSPFVASAALLGLSYALIRGLWSDNYGAGGSENSVGPTDILQIARLKQAWKIVREGGSHGTYLIPPLIKLIVRPGSSHTRADSNMF
jgi:hypothetical protein